MYYRELNTETGCCNSRSSSFDKQLLKGVFAPNERQCLRCKVYLKTLRLSMETGGEAYETSNLNPVIHAFPTMFRAAERSHCV